MMLIDRWSMFLIEAYIVGTHFNYHDRFIKNMLIPI